MSDNQTQRPFAVITGASNGIGFELARLFVQHGFDLLIAASSDKIDQAAGLLGQNGVQVHSYIVDLAAPDGADRLFEGIQSFGRPIDALCLNAGIGVSGAFTETSLDEEMRLINLNIISSVQLAKFVVPRMVERNQGRVMFTSSVAAVMPSPYDAVYGASKAFLLMFSEALASELEDTAVAVTAVLPGPTETNFFHRANVDETKIGHGEKDDATEVAKRAFDAMIAGKEKAYVGGFKNRVMGMMADLLPDDFGAKEHKKMTQSTTEGQASVR